MLGVAFSLWRAVFQAGHDLKPETNVEDARRFFDDIVRNNAAAYRDELNSWSLGYYLNNARFRIILAGERLAEGEMSDELGELVQQIETALKQNQDIARTEWERCFDALRLILDVIERRRGTAAA